MPLWFNTTHSHYRALPLPDQQMNAQITPFRLEKSRHAAPQVFEYLREQIMSLTLAPGTVLSRADLVDQFGVSQTPIRDALMRLARAILIAQTTVACCG